MNHFFGSQRMRLFIFISCLFVSNTSSAWGIEAEFWVETGGSFVYNNTDLVAAGGTATPVEAFTFGDRVEGRARYYSGNGVGPWSAFSNIVFMH